MGTKKQPRAPKKPSVQTGTTVRRNTGNRTKALREQLQEQAFLLNVIHGKTCREIGKELGIDKDTASKYIRDEEKRRGQELSDARDAHTARAVAFYSAVATKGIKLAEKAEEAFMQPLARGLDSAIHARERIDKLLGLDAPTKVDVGLQKLVDALTVGGDDRTKPLE